MKRRLLLVCLMFSLLPLPAQAVFSDAWAALRDDPRGVSVSVGSLEITQLNAGKESLALLNGFLSPWELQVSDVSGNGMIRLTDRDSGQTVCFQAEQTGRSLPFLSGADALEDLWETVLPGLFTQLTGEEPPETEEVSTYFRVLGRSAARQSLTISPEQFRALPRDTLSPLFSCLTDLFRGCAAAPFVSAYLDSLTLEGEMTARRNLDDAGRDMAFQFGGRIGSDGEDIRKLTFIIGKNGDIFYFSVKAPAVRGGGSFQASLTVPAWSENKTRASRKITWSVRRTADKNTWKLTDTLQLSSQKGKNEAISAGFQRELNDGSGKQVWQLTLKLQSDGDGTLRGTLSGRQQHAATDVVRWQAAVSAGPAGSTPDAGAVSEAEAAVLLARLLSQKRSQLSQSGRRQLDHLLRTDSWMNGAAAAPLPEMNETEE